jgi:hypothetical protein
MPAEISASRAARAIVGIEHGHDLIANAACRGGSLCSCEIAHASSSLLLGAVRRGRSSATSSDRSLREREKADQDQRLGACGREKADQHIGTEQDLVIYFARSRASISALRSANYRAPCSDVKGCSLSMVRPASRLMPCSFIRQDRGRHAAALRHCRVRDLHPLSSDI